MAERRGEDRRGGERREFRAGTGRRDPAAVRRIGSRRYLVPVLVLGLPLVVGLAFRSLVVVPRDALQLEVGRLAPEVRSILSRTPQVGLGFPGGPEPSPGPVEEAGPVPMEKDMAGLGACLERLAPKLNQASSVPALPRVVGLCAFLLGDERRARMAWQEVLAHGGAEQVAEAEVGLASLGVMAATRTRNRGDRLFALSQSLERLERASAHPHATEAARHNKELVLSLLEPVGEEPSPAGP